MDDSQLKVLGDILGEAQQKIKDAGIEAVISKVSLVNEKSLQENHDKSQATLRESPGEDLLNVCCTMWRVSGSVRICINWVMC